ncbi:MAG TPA: DinB family protein, partial [Vicinamibacterales bacterium]|nr:DinB family protein [Vicinamibacterales bacterium]
NESALPGVSPVAMTDHDRTLRDHLVKLLDSDQAHLRFDDAVRDFPPALRGVRPEGGPHSAWELLEHLRITLWDILEFTRDAQHVSPEFPDGYWPSSAAPPTERAWDESVAAFRRDLRAMAGIAADSSIDLYARIPHGDGQTVLREILLVADHNAYHLGQLVMVRRLLGG